MEGHSVEQRTNHKILLSKSVLRSRNIPRITFFYPRRPAESTLVAKFESTGSINNQPTSIRRRNARSAENIAAVYESVRENPKWSISRRSQELGLSATSIWQILHRDLDLHPYKIQLTQELKVNDHR